MKPETIFLALWQALRRRHIHRHIATRINRHGDVTYTCRNCRDSLTIENPKANRTR